MFKSSSLATTPTSTKKKVSQSGYAYFKIDRSNKTEVAEYLRLGWNELQKEKTEPAYSVWMDWECRRFPNADPIMYSEGTRKVEKYKRNHINQVEYEPDIEIKQVENEEYIPVMNSFIRKYARHAEDLVALLFKKSRLGKHPNDTGGRSCILNVPFYTDRDLTLICCMFSLVRWETGIANVIEVIPRQRNIKCGKNNFQLKPSSSVLLETIFSDDHEETNKNSFTVNGTETKLLVKNEDKGTRIRLQCNPATLGTSISELSCSSIDGRKSDEENSYQKMRLSESKTHDAAIDTLLDDIEKISLE
ncbi:unnamed protein product [Ambrosiozyma monospora]|uniref:Unnamed protein product n=1 Tax=Ambrosiozyma monospora TaxID=43982 RepID=A0A9W6Z0R1_AMBMO|nr:unnamed protein product [Ambrosiozyma monospora]